MCEHANKKVNPVTLDEDFVCDIDGKPCRLANPNKYKCSKTSAK